MKIFIEGIVPAIKNGIWNSLANAGSLVTGIVGSILVVRSLTHEEYGTLSYYLWLANTLGTLGILALPNAVTKITSELRGNDQESEAHSLSRWVSQCLLAFNILLSVGLILWAFYAPAAQRIYLLIIAVVLVPNALTAVLRSTLWGRERYKPVAVIIVVSSLLQLAFIGLSYIFNWNVPGFLAALLSINIVQATGLALVFRSPANILTSVPKLFPRPERPILKRYLAFALPATLVLCYEVIVWQRSEIFFLERLSSLEQVGFYNLAYTVFGMLLAIGWALVHGFYPAISRDYGAGEWLQIREKVRQGLMLASLFAIPLTFGGWAILNNLTTLLYTSKMLPMVPVARILLIGLLPGVLTGLFSILVNAVGGIWVQVRIGLVIAFLSIGLDLILIPPFGALGGAIANTATQVLYFIFLAVFVQRKYSINFPLRPIMGIIVSGAFTTFLMPTLAQIWFSGVTGLVGAIILAMISYVTIILSLGYLRSFRPAQAGV